MIAGSMTSQLQPLDVSLPVKDRIQALYTECLLDGCHEFTPGNRKDEAVKDAWGTVSSAMVIKAFSKCGISDNPMDRG